MKLEQIAPKWYKRIKKGYLTPSQVKLLSDPSKCVVGEAHGWKRTYLNHLLLAGHPDLCEECDECGQMLFETMTAEYESLGNGRKRTPVPLAFKLYLERLEKHWYQKHLH